MPNPDGSPTVAEAIDAINHSGTTNQNAPNPIGVPIDYVAKRTQQTTEDDLAWRGGRPGARQVASTITSKVPAQYFEGDDWVPSGFPPGRIADLQRSLIAANIINKKDNIQIGVWDPVSRKAYRDLLSYANGAGMSMTEALNYIGAQGGMADQTTKRAPLQVRLTNPEDLKPAFIAGVMKATGQAWSNDRIDAMVAAYQQQERTAQEQDYAQGETGGTVVQPPSAASFAAAQAKQQDPGGVEAHDALGYENKFFSMLKGVV